ncbi:Gfo/Idh/MocA family oxidoreductase [Amycolatopsis oliviviridis]|uniref:Oxidoreductase n=1 Tax=Amycolatopsis oliviviridis TaxID=1471590 RepID=A0ABQ3L3S0_9PSEU|nr:Gfo/Idh/MocA family oxidoreductase [Amycolatopsis oliviviridis]GHH01291.1 oxidoreductase [Amycolatopsis oliviviridis]
MSHRPTGGPAPVRVGVLGCADIARRRTLPALVACPGTEPVAVASRTPVKAGALAAEFGCRPVTGYERLLADDGIDAVYIAVPAGLHAEWCAKALSAGRHVLVEKPFAVDTAEADALVDLAGARGRVLMENRMFARHPQHALVRSLIDAGRIGEPKVLTATMAMPRRAPDDIRYRGDLAGGALLDVGYYPIGAAVLLFGPDWDVVGAVLDHDDRLGVDTGGDILLRSAGGVSAHLTFGFDHYYRAAYQVRGSAGTITAERAFTPPPTLSPTVRVEGAGGHTEISVSPFDQFRAVAADFAAAVQGTGEWAGHLATSLHGVALTEAVLTWTSLAPQPIRRRSGR